MLPTKATDQTVRGYCKGSARVPPTPFHLEGLAVEP